MAENGGQLPSIMGIPIPEADDQLFDRIPAILWLPDVTALVIINLSCHKCDICTSNHRTRDHACFAVTRRSRLPNPYQISVGQLQNINGKLLGQSPVPMAIKADPGVLYIRLGDDVETWTCALCDFECGLALDSAFHHIHSPGHGLRLMQSETQQLLMETLADQKVHTLLERAEIATFLASEM
ncbi:unnamed protein product [Closterium sp. Naga37s-1]|nr:unnamed protein product [Closterium sp. Naga37s-1]